MSSRRTHGMTILAVVDFLFGALLVGSGTFAVLVGHASLSSSLQAEPAVMAALQSVALGLLGLGVGVVGIVAGVALFKVARWTFAICVVHACALTLLQCVNLIWVLNQSMSVEARRIALLGQSAGLAYPLAVILLSMKWRRAFGMTHGAPA